MTGTRQQPVGRTAVRCGKATLPAMVADRLGTRHAPIRLAGILILALALTACGWKLRGSYNLPPEITPVAVDGDGVANELRNTLRINKALAASSGEPAASRLEVLQESNNRRVISVNESGKVDEYEVRYEVRWQLTAKGSGGNSRRILIAPTTFRANRSYDYAASTVLSTNEQEQRLLETMREDLAQRILFRLQGLQIGDND